MAVFLQGKEAPSIWNKKSEKILTFVNGELETEDEFTISLLKKYRYKIKPEKKDERLEKLEKPIKTGKPGRPKADKAGKIGKIGKIDKVNKK